MEKQLRIASVEEVGKGKGVVAEVDGKEYAVFNVEGTICVIQNFCPHRGGALGKGLLSGEVVTCPWHGARFDVRDGKVLRGPARQDLYTYAVKIEDDDISIYLPPEA